MSRSSTSLYDRQITIFSPEGKLFQVEYAFRAVNSSNITVVALKGKQCAVIVGQKKVSSQALRQDKLLDTSSLSSLYHVTPRIGGAFVGLPADCRSMVFRAREKANEFEHENDMPIPLSHLVYKVANINQVFTQHAYMRLHACVGILISIDEDMGPCIFKFDPAGWFTGNKAAVVGTKEQEATNTFEKMLKKKVPETIEDTITSAILCLQSTLGLDFKPTDLEIGLVTTDDPVFRRLSDDEVDTYLTLLAERD
eukprot:Gregarina_sp_Poly_1__2723@NODE_1750_length_3408_cov_354_567495_g1146_i0_p2_GENE_NODE_1750_length_3408_cov_354_567495_g1146_i0NODE_1750_length_3408_cov_354_567495_g1146_i0_p2_ORF_typecomplete_len253_score25_41Proteasome/PF00227_26/1_3e30Proteasome_A_N/PF10584_9/1_5e13Helicase_C_3/PF13625_6/1e04Helicase_C_3/PF13625_6/0_12_NODE_1750_length_3408_cov_354_567495_g1146_i024263184